MSIRKVDEKCEAQTAWLDGVERLFDQEPEATTLEAELEAAQRRNAQFADELDKMAKTERKHVIRIRELENRLLDRKDDANREDDRSRVPAGRGRWRGASR